jgi:Ca2+-transporting ATPase
MLFSSQKNRSKSIFSGTLVASGLAIYRVTTIGPNTEVGKLGSSLQNKETPTPLQIKFKIESDGNYGYCCFLISLGCLFLENA